MSDQAIANPAPGTESVLGKKVLVYGLAVLGIVLVGWGLWTWAAWGLSGPRQITVGREPGSASWWAARLLEAGMWIGALPVAVFVVRRCLRARRFWTFDVTLCVAFLLCLWQDPVVNFFEPVLLFSTNFVNLSTWCSNMPVSPNALCPLIPEPWLFEVPFYLFDFLGFLIVFNRLMRAIKRRWPGTSALQMGVIAYALSQLLNIGFMSWATHNYLWSFPALGGSLFASNVRYPIADSLAFSCFFAAMSLMRFYRQETGSTFIERRLSVVPKGQRGLIGWLALNGYIQLWFLIVSSYDIAAASISTRNVPELPAHLMGAVCSTGEWARCPGGTL